MCYFKVLLFRSKINLHTESNNGHKTHVIFKCCSCCFVCLVCAACLPGLYVWIFGLNAGSIRKLWTAVPPAMTGLNLKVDFDFANVPSTAALKGGKG